MRRTERSLAISWITFQNWRFATASMADVGSSSTRMDGVPISARASMSFLLFPPESLEAWVRAWRVRSSLAMRYSTFSLTFCIPLMRP